MRFILAFRNHKDIQMYTLVDKRVQNKKYLVLETKH